MIPQLTPILPSLAALEVRLIVFVVMMILAFISWVSRQIAAARENSRPAVRPRRTPNDPLRSEVQTFLEESEARSRSRAEEVQIEVVPDDEANQRMRQRPQPARRPAAAGRPAGRPVPQRPQGAAPMAGRPAGRPTAARTSPPLIPASAPERQRPAGQIQTQAAAGTGALGGGVRSHLQEYMGGRIDQQVKEHLSGGMKRGVQQDLGSVPTMESVAAGAEHPIVRLLRAPGGARQAVMIAEILVPRHKRSRK